MYLDHGRLQINPKNVSAEPFTVTVSDQGRDVKTSIDNLIDEVRQVPSASDPEAAMQQVLKAIRTSGDRDMQAVGDRLNSSIFHMPVEGVEEQTASLVRNALQYLGEANDKVKSSYVKAQAALNKGGGY